MCFAVNGAVFATRRPGGGRLGTALVVVYLDPEGGLEVVMNRKGELPIRRRSRAGDTTRVEVPAHWSWPATWAFLTASEWAPGEPRVPGTITLFLDGTRLKVCFHDKDSGEVGFATLEGSLAVLDAIELALRDDKVDWRRPKTPERKK